MGEGISRLAAIIVLLVSALWLTACDRTSASHEPPPYPSFDTASPAASDDTTTMPDLSGMRLSEVHNTFEPHVFGEVWVTFPSETITQAVEAQCIAGTEVPARVLSYVNPERRLMLQQGPTDHYVVMEQSVAPGEPLVSGVSVELTASPIGSATRGWAHSGHTAAVKQDGATPCFECHTENACATCHVALLDN